MHTIADIVRTPLDVDTVVVCKGIDVDTNADDATGADV